MNRDDDTPAPEAPKTTRAAAKAERRQQLIDATIASIAKYGLSGTTLAKVTEIAGTSIGLANFHFATKDRLFEAVLTQLADEQRACWQNRNLDASLSTADRLLTMVDSRFHPAICDRRKLAIWFAFYGDAGARDIYRRVVEGVDDERLHVSVSILGDLITEGGYVGVDALQTALGLEALYDGFWLNMLLYPSDFRRLACRTQALNFLAAILPRHFSGTGPGA